MIIVDVSASTGAFVGTVCLIAVRRSVSGRTGCLRCGGELIRPLVSVDRLVLLLPDMYRLLDRSVHSVAFSVDDYPHLRQPVRPESERRTAIRQTVPKKTSVEVETSTLI